MRGTLLLLLVGRSWSDGVVMMILMMMSCEYYSLWSVYFFTRFEIDIFLFFLIFFFFQEKSNLNIYKKEYVVLVFAYFVFSRQSHSLLNGKRLNLVRTVLRIDTI